MATNILIVQAKASIGRMLKFVLGGAGYGAVEVSNGWDAIHTLKAARCALVLCDLELLRRDGLNLLNAVRETDPHCSVVVMTAYGDIGSATQLLREGARDFLTRPVDPDHLLHVVKRVLQTRVSGEVA